MEIANIHAAPPDLAPDIPARPTQLTVQRPYQAPRAEIVVW
jgi:hypothetical protein